MKKVSDDSDFNSNGKKGSSSKVLENDLDQSQMIEEKFYNALDHEIRRNILKIVGKNGTSSFTHFKKTLKVSTGTLYHHLDVLKELITQNKTRKYILTNLGKLAYNFLIKNYDSFESNKIHDQKLITERFKRLFVFVPVKTIDKIKSNSKFGWTISSVFLIFFFLLIFFGKVDSNFIFFQPYNNIFPTVTVLEQFFLGAKFIISVILCAVSSEILSRFIFGKSGNTLNFFSVYVVGLFPMLIYLVVFDILMLINPVFAESVLSKIIMIFFQMWAIWLISYIVTIFKEIKLERSLLITFLIHYIAFNIQLFT